MKNSIKKALKIRKRYEKIWMGLENVTAVGAGKTKEGKPCIVISMLKEDPATRDIFPQEIEDVPIELIIIGKIDAG